MSFVPVCLPLTAHYHAEALSPRPTGDTRRIEALRRLPRVYNTQGHFYDRRDKRPFDFVFTEFFKDPSLPRSMFPHPIELAQVNDVTFLGHHQG